MTSRLPALAFVLAASVALLGACGEKSSEKSPVADGTASAGASSDAAGDLPACTEVWQEGADLPKDYKGCAVDGEAVEVERLPCSSGQRVYLYDDHFWAVRGHVISFAEDGLSEDTKYQEMLFSCRA